MNESLLIALIGAPRSIGYDGETTGWLEKTERARVLTQVLPRPFPQSEVLSSAAIVSALTRIQFSPKTELFLGLDDLAFATQMFLRFPPGNRVIALGFGATIGRRQWPAARWTEALNLLARYHRLSILILATQSESEEASRICSALDAHVEVLVSKSVREVAACIAKSNLFLGTDSGMAHVASAVRVPVVVVSPHTKNGDPTHYNSPLRFAPFGERVVVVNPDAATPPCSDSCKYQNAHCILQVAPREVVQACLDQLGGSFR